MARDFIVTVDAHMVEPCQHIDGCAPGEEVEHHLMSYLRRIGTHAFCCDAMIGSEYVDRFAQGSWEVPFTDREPLRSQIFQPSQTPQWFGERVEVGPGLRKISNRRDIHRASLR